MMVGSLPRSTLCWVKFCSEMMSTMASDVTFDVSLEGLTSGEGMISFTFDC